VQVMEPRTSRPAQRLKAIRKLSDAGIPVGVMAAPVIPGLNDHELPAVLKAAADAGAMYANYILLRLPYAVSELFQQFLQQHYPSHANKIINRIKHIRGGKLNVSEFGERFRGTGIFAEQINQVFEHAKTKYGFIRKSPNVTAEHFRIPKQKDWQPLLWE